MAIRKPVVAGQFYDANPHRLRACVDTFMHNATKTEAIANAPLANLVVLPHAGHMYCGHVIAKTLAHVSLASTLILLGPNHTGMGEAMAVWHEGAWQSPLGDMPVDQTFAKRLLDAGVGFTPDTKAHVREHSLEVLVPFLHMAKPDARIVPVAIRESNLTTLTAAGEALAAIIADMALQGQACTIIVSTDMHHFSDHETTMALDALALKPLMALDTMGLASAVMSNKISMCGVLPALLATVACKCLGLRQCALVSHTTSYETSNDASRVVGYAGLFAVKNAC